MTSLTTCLKKATAIHPADKAAVMAESKRLRGTGLSTTEAAQKAVAAQIASVQSEMTAHVAATAAQATVDAKAVADEKAATAAKAVADAKAAEPAAPVKPAKPGGPAHALRHKSAQFSKKALAVGVKANTFREAVQVHTPERAQTAWTNITDVFHRVAPYLLTSFQIAQQWGGDGVGKIKSLMTHIALQDAMKQERNRLSERVYQVVLRADKLAPAEKARLNPLMQLATMSEVHPDLAFDHADNKHLHSADPVRQAQAKLDHAAIERKYNALLPETKAVYQAVKGEMAAEWAERTQALKDLIDQTYSAKMIEASDAGDFALSDAMEVDGRKSQKDIDSQLKKIKGPYFPLLRFGDYLAVGESAEFKAAREALQAANGEYKQEGPDGEAQTDRRSKLRTSLDAMKKDAAHYEVSAHDDRAAQMKAVAALKARGLTESRASMADQHADVMPTVAKSTMDHLSAAIAQQFDAATAAQIDKSMQQIFLRSMPESNALGREAARKGVAGASVDMLRAVAASGQQNAFHISRLKYAKPMADNLFKMKQETKGDIKLSHIHREMEKRMALDMKYSATPVQDVLNSISWAYHLGVSPTFLFINSTQPFLVTGPVLAGKFGLANASRALGRASRDSLAVVRAARYANGKWDAWSGINEATIPTTGRTAEGVAEDRKMIRALMQRGILDENSAHDLPAHADDSSKLMAKVNRNMGWMSQQIEMVNRMTTALASFRLARADGMDFDKATDYAYKATLETQMDYSGPGAARIMREGGGVPLAKMVFQFRRYQQAMLYLLVDNVKKAFGTGAEASAARATLGYFAVTSGLTAGVMGLPFMGVALFLKNLFGDGDDERGDAETQLRNMLFDMTGNKDVADVVALGLPAMFGANLSRRIGLNDVASPFPMARLDGKTGQDKSGQALMALVGPSGGLAAQAFDAVSRFEQGDWAKGVEKLVPKSLSDVIRAGRYATQGMTDNKGEEILGPEEISAWNIALRAAGTAAVQETNYYEGSAAKKNTEQAVTDRKTRISHQFSAALRDGDMGNVRDKIEEFNADHPAMAIKPKDEMAWRKAARRSAGQRDDATGIKFDPKRDKNYADTMRFARGG